MKLKRLLKGVKALFKQSHRRSDKARDAIQSQVVYAEEAGSVKDLEPTFPAPPSNRGSTSRSLASTVQDCPSVTNSCMSKSSASRLAGPDDSSTAHSPPQSPTFLNTETQPPLPAVDTPGTPVNFSLSRAPTFYTEISAPAVCVFSPRDGTLPRAHTDERSKNTSETIYCAATAEVSPLSYLHTRTETDPSPVHTPKNSSQGAYACGGGYNDPVLVSRPHRPPQGRVENNHTPPIFKPPHSVVINPARPKTERKCKSCDSPADPQAKACE
eukprot:1604555-Rhodomonas_salina.1